jgi:hypothetical protein
MAITPNMPNVTTCDMSPTIITSFPKELLLPVAAMAAPALIIERQHRDFEKL